MSFPCFIIISPSSFVSPSIYIISIHYLTISSHPNASVGLYVSSQYHVNTFLPSCIMHIHLSHSLAILLIVFILLYHFSAFSLLFYLKSCHEFS